MTKGIKYLNYDQLNFIDLQQELKSMINIDVNDPLEVYVDNETVIFKKSTRCAICNSSHDTIEYRDRRICRDCINKLKS